MGAAENKAIVRRYFAELVSQGKLDVADELFAPTFMQHNENFRADVPPGPARAKDVWRRWRTGFPDWQAAIEDLLGEGDRVAARISAHGTHLGELRLPGRTLVPPTGRAISTTATVWFTLAEGRIADIEETHNVAALLRGIGIRPVDEPDSDANKAVVRRIAEEVWNRANPAAIDELFAPDFRRHGEVLGPAGVRAIIARLAAEQPDGRVTVEDLVAEGDKVVVRSTRRWTYGGLPTEDPLLGRVLPQPGTVVSGSRINIFRLVDGKAAEVWELIDDPVFLARRLGLLPMPSQTST